MKNILKVVAGAVIALGLTVGAAGVANAAPTKRVVADAAPVAVDYVKGGHDDASNTFVVANLTGSALTVVVRYENSVGGASQTFVGLDAHETVTFEFARDRGATLTVFYGASLSPETSVSAVAR